MQLQTPSIHPTNLLVNNSNSHMPSAFILLRYMATVIYNSHSDIDITKEIIWQFFIYLSPFGKLLLTPSLLNTIRYAAQSLSNYKLTLLMVLTLIHVRWHVTHNIDHFFLSQPLFSKGFIKIHGAFIDDIALQYKIPLNVPGFIKYSTTILNLE
jgi:hypothetical protein